MMACFSSKATKVKRQWNISYAVRKNYKPRNPCPVKISVRDKGRIDIFLDEGKRKDLPPANLL